jgi:FAD dependent oxidoreductase
VRMEPQYMIIGQAAGVAAAMAVHGRSGVQDVAISELQERLRAHGGILHLREEFSGGGVGK